MRKINIPIFVPHLGCPHDCVFCNQRRITGCDSKIDAAGAKAIVEAAMQTLPEDRKEIRVEIAFFGGSFTAIEPELQESLLDMAYGYVVDGRADGIRLSTRPDCVEKEALARLTHYGVTAVELGVQSTDDEVLLQSGRGHCASDSFSAAQRVRDAGFELGLQMMLGLPGSTWSAELKTAQDIAAMHPATVRVYPTLVLRDSLLCDMLLDGKYEPLSLEEATHRCARLYPYFTQRGIGVIRMGLMASEEISSNGSVVAGPLHPAFGELVYSQIYLGKIRELCKNRQGGQLVLYVNPREISKVAGNRKANLAAIYHEFGIKLSIKPDAMVEVGKVIC